MDAARTKRRRCGTRAAERCCRWTSTSIPIRSACSMRVSPNCSDSSRSATNGKSWVSPRLCLAGGVALNSKANGELLRSGLIDDIYIQPAAGDDGGCIGAAFAVYEKLGLPLPRNPISHTYLGPEFGNDEIEKVLRVY